MHRKWPLELMEVGDYAIITGLVANAVRNHVSTYAARTGKKFTVRDLAVGGLGTGVRVQRLDANGQIPHGDGERYDMDASPTPEMKAREEARIAAKREAYRRQEAALKAAREAEAAAARKRHEEDVAKVRAIWADPEPDLTDYE